MCVSWLTSLNTDSKFKKKTPRLTIFYVSIISTHMISDIDDCSPNQCQNSATCVDGVDSFSCTCTAGYEGDLCEISEYSPLQNRVFRHVYQIERW